MIQSALERVFQTSSKNLVPKNFHGNAACLNVFIRHALDESNLVVRQREAEIKYSKNSENNAETHPLSIWLQVIVIYVL